MDEEPLFDLHWARCRAQSAAIWAGLEAIAPRLFASAETITLPASEDPRQSGVSEWIAHRYWQLIEIFVAKVNEDNELGLAPNAPS
jgi:hypothetical protein